MPCPIEYKEMPLPQDNGPVKNLVIGEVYNEGCNLLTHVITPHLISPEDVGFNNSSSVTNCIFPRELEYVVRGLVDQYKNHPDNPHTAFIGVCYDESPNFNRSGLGNKDSLVTMLVPLQRENAVAVAKADLENTLDTYIYTDNIPNAGIYVAIIGVVLLATAGLYFLRRKIKRQRAQINN